MSRVWYRLALRLLPVFSSAGLSGQQPLDELEFRRCIADSGEAWCNVNGQGRCGPNLNVCILRGYPPGTVYEISADGNPLTSGSTFRIGRSQITVAGQEGFTPTIRRAGDVSSLMATGGYNGVSEQQHGVLIQNFAFDGNRHGFSPAPNGPAINCPNTPNIGRGCLCANQQYFDLNVDFGNTGTSELSSLTVRNSPSHGILVKGNPTIDNVEVQYARSTGIYAIGAPLMQNLRLLQNGTAGITLQADAYHPSTGPILRYSILRENRREGSDPSPGGQLVIALEGVANAIITGNVIDGGSIIIPSSTVQIPSPVDPSKTCSPQPPVHATDYPQHNDGIESWGSGHQFLNNIVINNAGTGISLAWGSGIVVAGGIIGTTTERDHSAIAITGTPGAPVNNVNIGCLAPYMGCSSDVDGPFITGPHRNAVRIESAGSGVSNVGVFRTAMSGHFSGLAVCRNGAVAGSHYMGNAPANPFNENVILSCQSSDCPASISPQISNFGYSGGVQGIVLSTGAGCQWSATGSWAVPSPTTGIGNSSLSVFASPTSPDWWLPRTGSITVAGQVSRFVQAPVNLLSTYTFGDVDYNHPLYALNGQFGFGNYIALLKLYSVTNGCGPGVFCPADSLTRGQIAAFLVRAMLYRYTDTPNCLSGYPRAAENPCGFTVPATTYFNDVSSQHGFYPYIQKLAEFNIAEPCETTNMGPRFCPDMFVSRGEMAVMLIKAMALKGKFDMSFAYPAAPFYTDVPAGHPQFPYIQKLKQQGITGGTSASTYSPLDPLQRFMMAAFLVRAFFTEP